MRKTEAEPRPEIAPAVRWLVQGKSTSHLGKSGGQYRPTAWWRWRESGYRLQTPGYVLNYLREHGIAHGVEDGEFWYFDSPLLPNGIIASMEEQLDAMAAASK